MEEKDKKEKEGKKDQDVDNCCCYYADPCGCYMMDPCGCYYVDPCCC